MSGVDALTLIAQALFNNDWQQGSAFIFRNRTGCRIKLLCWNQHGVGLCHRHLHQGRFVWLKVEATSWTLTQAQFDWLITRVD